MLTYKSFYCFFFLCLPALLYSQSNEELLRIGYQYLQAEQHDKAIERFDEILEKDNKNGQAYYYRGKAHKESEQFENALKDFNWVISFSQNDSLKYWAAIKNSAIYRNEMINLNKALQFSQKALDIDSLRSYAWHMKGLVLYSLKEFDEAIVHFDKAIHIDPLIPHPYYDRALTKRALHKSLEAIADYDRTIALDSTYERAYNNRGFVNLHLENYKLAIKDFNKALKLEVGSSAYNNRGYAKLKLGDLKGAKRDCELALKIDDTNSWAYHNLGLIYYETGDKARACELFHQAVEHGKEEVAEEIKKKCLE